MSKNQTQYGQPEGAESDQAGAAQTGQAVKNKTGNPEPENSRDSGGDPNSGLSETAFQTQNNGAQGENGADGVEKDAESVSLPTPGEKIAELEAQLAEARDQLLRKAADFENFRKRMNQDKQNAIDFANQSLLLDIVPIIDDFERAIQAAKSSNDFTALLDGITMIEKRLTSQLESKWGLKRFDSKGEPFDPNRHEALMMEKSPDVAEPVVQEDLIKGYLLKDRVIRAAKVKVLMPEAGT